VGIGPVILIVIIYIIFVWLVAGIIADGIKDAKKRGDEEVPGRWFCLTVILLGPLSVALFILALIGAAIGTALKQIWVKIKYILDATRKTPVPVESSNTE
jgi:hypothetical protein